MLAGSGIVGMFLDLATAFLRGILPGVGTKRRITKRQNYKTAKLQNGDYYKTSKSQNGDYYKTATVTKRRKKIFQIFYKNHSKTKILYSKSIIHRNFIISNFISSITLSTGKILKIRPTVFPKYMLAIKRQWFDTFKIYTLIY